MIKIDLQKRNKIWFGVAEENTEILATHFLKNRFEPNFLLNRFPDNEYIPSNPLAGEAASPL